MSIVDKNKSAEAVTTVERKRKRVSLRDATSSKGPLWLPSNIIPGHRLYWAGITVGNPYKLYQMMEIGYGPLTEEQKKIVFGLVPTGMMTQTSAESGSWITKQSGSVTHYLMCIPTEDHLDIEREKKEMREERDAARMAEIHSNPVLTSAQLNVRGNSVKTWDS